MNKSIVLTGILAIALIFNNDTSYGQKTTSYVSFLPQKGLFALARQGKVASLLVDSGDFKGVNRALTNLQADIEAVTGVKPGLYSQVSRFKEVVIVGTIGKNRIIDQLIASGKLNVTGVSGKWETYIQQTINNPLPGIEKAFVIAGSDKRGTIYGIYDLSARIGVSPWYYWADVPVQKHTDIFIRPGKYSDGTPAVKYRGIFINDEAPAFSGWAKEKFGGVNHLVYEKVFELILRLKGNYLWPAMWANAFNDDDKQDPVLADEYGIVMGTSHHEPMDRAQQEWKRYGSGEWDYETNAKTLQDFWRKGIQNMGTKETIVTVGMRGDGDMAMTQGSNIALLEKIVADQRQILAEETKKDASKTPQLWALYKEVQDYYDKGMRVPDDVTLLLCDDNWGNIRKLPKLNELQRAGGYGIYYHFDYVGGPRNYKWLNTNPISKTWEQMHLAHEYGANQIWIVNVGDIKPMEFPISFFLDYAWAPNKYPASSLDRYTENWASQQFGPKYAKSIAYILSKYTRYNGRRKPELINENSYSLLNYREFETIVKNYNQLESEAEAIGKKLPANMQDAYFQLVLHPVKACANFNQLYYRVAQNHLYAKQMRAATNDMADKVKELYHKDAEISNYYNQAVAGGKWNHLMDQTHIGYTYWQQPAVNKMPDVKYISLPEKAAIGVAVEGSDESWPGSQNSAVLPAFNNIDKQSHYIEIFNKGKQAISFTVKASRPWIKVFPQAGSVVNEQRLEVTIDRAKLPSNAGDGIITITDGTGSTVSITAKVDKVVVPPDFKGFTESDGYVAIEAAHFQKAVNAPDIKWHEIPDYGRTLSGITTFPVTSAIQKPRQNSPRLAYKVLLRDTGSFNLNVYVSPSLDFNNTGGLKFAISVDDGPTQVLNLQADNTDAAWSKNVANNINKLNANITIKKPGAHTINYWMMSAGVVLQKLVIDCGKLKPSYIGPPESYLIK